MAGEEQSGERNSHRTLDNRLELLIGAVDSRINLEVLIRNTQTLLGKRSVENDFEMHFLLFNALTLLADYGIDSATYDAIDREIADYILTCRKSTEADIMLCDLLIAHYPVERAARLSRLILIKCRWIGRRDAFWGELVWHRGGISPQFRSALLPVLDELRIDKRPSRISLSCRIDRVFT